MRKKKKEISKFFVSSNNDLLTACKITCYLSDRKRAYIYMYICIIKNDLIRNVCHHDPWRGTSDFVEAFDIPRVLFLPNDEADDPNQDPIVSLSVTTT